MGDDNKIPQSAVKRVLQTSWGMEVFTRDVENARVTARASYVDANLTIDVSS